MKKWKLGIVGLGAAARKIHIPAYNKIEQIDIVGGVDPNIAGSNFKFPIFESLSTLMEHTQPEIIAIVTPPDSHFALTCEALRAGAHVFCEKPFVSTLDEGRTVIELAKSVNREVFVNNEFRFMNVHESAAEKIRSADFGELLFLSLNQTFFTTEETEAGWRGRGDRRTCYEFGTHTLDLCRFFFAAEPLSIAARMPKPYGDEQPDYLNIIELDFGRGRIAHILLDRLSRGPHRYLDIRFDGSIGCIETSIGGVAEAAIGIKAGVRKPYARLSFAPSAIARFYANEKAHQLATDPLDLFPNATAKLLENALDAIEKKRRPPCNAADNLKTLALMLAAYESAERNGERIAV